MRRENEQLNQSAIMERRVINEQYNIVEPYYVMRFVKAHDFSRWDETKQKILDNLLKKIMFL